MKNVKEYVKEVNIYIYMKNNKVTYNRNVSKEKNEQIKYMEIYVEKYLWENIKNVQKVYKENIKNRKYKICIMCKKCI